MERKITIEAPVIYQEDYQLRMIQANQIEGILPVRGQGMNGLSRYDYEVSGKVSMKAMYERGKICAGDLKMLLKDLLAVIQETERYLLNIHCILLEPEYIFYESDKFFFCYYPLSDQDLWKAFHKLTDYFVKQADYKDQECVQLAFALHQGTMVENYSLERLVEESIQDADRETYEEWQAEKRDKKEISYDTKEHDWITEQELGSSIMEETENMWTPVKRFLTRHKKPKWGDWDGLYIEEEEL